VQLRIDTASSTPVHEQIHDQISRLVLAGALPTGTRLPSIRQLAGDLGIANGTVARAYRDLEQQHVLLTRRPHGTFVSARRPAPAERRRALQGLAQQFATQALQLGVDVDDALAAVSLAYQG
jgi:DNA-binding transcriptional regulator YhcF (GntR family)